MRKEKLVTIACVIISVAFVLILGYLIYFKMFVPYTNYIYELDMYYPEDLYKEYQNEIERMIASKDYTSKYHARAIFYSENNRTTLVIEIGDYDVNVWYANYMTATVKNFGTKEQEVTFERSRESAEEAYRDAEEYKNLINVLTVVFVIILAILGRYLVVNSMKKRYERVLGIMIVIIIGIVINLMLRSLTQ